ncbi:DNase I-like protein [Trematosphaeria pertusa]|uniref:DNA-(apurinic or apyrimidinic site) endonuclease 2 n=1 Tax=Trematosphaeria pertusa TaxID=390896 RepID=A0A6A6HT07_9PLEO|nr:DNase I-like protein [Trematosphaeria pertusa]KAF2241305.1 DNase I-like protein [Trematosphaeria pertusa]
MPRITTWNVNGIRNPFGYQPWRENRTFNAMFDILEADVVVMQELKIQRKDLTDDMVLVPGWDCYFSLPKHKKGYSGVGIYTRQSVCAPIRAEEGLLGVLCPPGSSTAYRDLPEDARIGGYPTPLQIADLGVDPASLDAEGRCVVLEFPAFVLFGVYSPANSNGQRDNFRYGFITALDTRIRNLAGMGKRVVLTGDLNVSREEIDTAKAEESMRQEGMTREEYLNAPNRRVFNQLIENGKVPGDRDEGRERPVLWDICREFHPMREGMYTHWEQKINARPGNFGSRIDYVLCSIEMKTWFADSNIQEGLMGSDHCPVYAATKDVVDCRGKQVHILDIMNPPGMFKDGSRVREFSATRDLLSLSGKLLPEFDRRRNIKDMFKKRTTTSPKDSQSIPNAARGDISQPLTLAVSQPLTLAVSQPLSLAISQPLTLAGGATTLPAHPAASTGPGSKRTTTPSPLNSPEKRRSSGAPAAKSTKRSKLSVGASSSSQSLAKGQQSLKGFFAPKQANTNPESSSQTPARKRSADTGPVEPSAADVTDAPPQAPPQPATEPFVDPQASKESWVKLFSKKPPPRCEGHDEPCISLITKKPGVNCGRQFWICPRPIGPSGQKETGTQWRCGTFIWASDWNAPSSRT